MKTLNQIKQDILDLAHGSIDPPTDKQAWYLAKLLNERGVDADSRFDGMVTGRRVSQLIDSLVNNPDMFRAPDADMSLMMMG